MKFDSLFKSAVMGDKDQVTYCKVFPAVTVDYILIFFVIYNYRFICLLRQQLNLKYIVKLTSFN